MYLAAKARETTFENCHLSSQIIWGISGPRVCPTAPWPCCSSSPAPRRLCWRAPGLRAGRALPREAPWSRAGDCGELRAPWWESVSCDLVCARPRLRRASELFRLETEERGRGLEDCWRTHPHPDPRHHHLPHPQSTPDWTRLGSSSCCWVTACQGSLHHHHPRHSPEISPISKCNPRHSCWGWWSWSAGRLITDNHQNQSTTKFQHFKNKRLCPP